MTENITHHRFDMTNLKAAKPTVTMSHAHTLLLMCSCSMFLHAGACSHMQVT